MTNMTKHEHDEHIRAVLAEVSQEQREVLPWVVQQQPEALEREVKPCRWWRKRGQWWWAPMNKPPQMAADAAPAAAADATPMLAAPQQMQLPAAPLAGGWQYYTHTVLSFDSMGFWPTLTRSPTASPSDEDEQ